MPRRVLAKLTICTAFALTLALYLLLPTKTYYWDGIDFALNIESANGISASLLHPNHLLYNVFGRIAYDLTRSITKFDVRALEVLRVVNSLLSVASAVVLLRTLQSATKNLYVSLCLTLIFAFSAVWWKFSTDANSYIPSVFFLLLCFRRLLPGDAASRPITTALLHTAAMLFHQLAVFFFPVALLGLWQQTTDADSRARARALVTYAALVFLLTFSSYLTGFYLQRGNLSAPHFAHWITNYSPDASFSFDLWNNLFYSLRGHVRLFLGGRLALAWRGGNMLMLVLLCAMLGATTLFAWRMARGARDLRLLGSALIPLDEKAKAMFQLALVWVGVYVVFLFFWLPHNTFYRLFYLPPLLMLLAAPLVSLHAHSGARRSANRLALFVLVLALFNFVAGIYPYSRVENNEPLALAFRLRRHWTPSTIVLYGMPTSDNELVRYFTPRVRWRQLPANVTLIEQQAREIEGRAADVWIETTMIDSLRSTPGGQAWLDAHIADASSYKLVDSRYRIEFYKLGFDNSLE